MSVEILSSQRTGRRAYLIKWASDLPAPVNFFVYRDGRLINETEQTEQSFVLDSGDGLVLEVLDDPNQRPITAFPGKFTITWFATPDTDHYRVEEFINAVWVVKAKITDLKEGYFKFKTRFVEDVTIHQFRVIPIGNNGNPGAIRLSSALMVRNPDPPILNFSYSNATETLTITE